jgi:phosphotransferase system HPr (HPr) family protein
MVEKTLIVKNKLGLHARPAALFVQTTAKFKASIKIIKDGETVDGKSIMGLMMLAAGIGTEIRILVDGVDEKELVVAVETLIENKFYEE